MNKNLVQIPTKEEYERLRDRRKMFAEDYRKPGLSHMQAAAIKDQIKSIDQFLEAYENAVKKIEVLYYQGGPWPVLKKKTEHLSGKTNTIATIYMAGEECPLHNVYVENARATLGMEAVDGPFRKVVVDAILAYFKHEEVYDQLINYGIIKE